MEPDPGHRDVRLGAAPEDLGDDELEIDLRKLLGTLRERWIWVAGFVAFALVLAVVYIGTAQPIYESTAQLLVDPGAGVQTGLGVDPSVASQRMGTRLALIQSPPVIDRAAALLTQQGHPEWAEALRDPQAVRASIQQGTENVIEIRFRAPVAEQARLGALAVAQAYEQFNRDEAQTQASAARIFLEGQLARTEQELEHAQDALRNYQRSSGIISLENEANRLNDQLSAVESQLASVTITLESRRFSLAQLSSEIEARRQSLARAAGNPSERLINELQAQLASLEVQRSDLRARGIQEAAPEIRAIDRRIQGAEQRLEEEVQRLTNLGPAALQGVEGFRDLQLRHAQLEAEIKSLENEAELLQGVVASYQDQLRDLSESGYQLARLERDMDVASNTYRLLREELERARLSEASELSIVRILREPQLPRVPVEPQPLLTMAVAVTLGGLGGVGTVFLLNGLDNRVKSPKQVERMGLTVLGSVPRMDDIGRPETALSGRDTADPLVRAYVRIDGNLRFSNVDRPPRVVTVTSPLPGEGKTTTAANLALLLAQGGERILLVDGDLMRPAVHQVFDIDNGSGLTELVAGMVSLEHVLRTVGGDHGFRLDVLPSGTRPPSLGPIFRSESFSRWLEDLRQRYDWVVIDGPPTLVVPEFLSVARLCDGAVMVARAQSTPVHAVQEAAAQLRSAGAKVLGVVLNQATTLEQGYYYGRSHYYYSGSRGFRQTRSIPGMWRRLLSRKETWRRKSSKSSPPEVN